MRNIQAGEYRWDISVQRMRGKRPSSGPIRQHAASLAGVDRNLRGSARQGLSSNRLHAAGKFRPGTDRAVERPGGAVEASLPGASSGAFLVHPGQPKKGSRSASLQHDRTRRLPYGRERSAVRGSFPDGDTPRVAGARRRPWATENSLSSDEQTGGPALIQKSGVAESNAHRGPGSEERHRSLCRPRYESVAHVMDRVLYMAGGGRDPRRLDDVVNSESALASLRLPRSKWSRRPSASFGRFEEGNFRTACHDGTDH